MARRIKISVAIATYNGARHLECQLESIARQTVMPFEVVISDDGSTDETIEIAQKFKAISGYPVKIIADGVRKGVFGNFMTAFGACEGGYIAYCDQDDYWEDNKIEIIVQSIESNNPTLVVHQSAIFDEQLKHCTGVSASELKDGAYVGQSPMGRVWGYGHAMVFRSDVLQVIRDLLAQPVDLHPQFFNNFDRFLLYAAGVVGDAYVIAKPLTRFRRHSQSVSNAGKQNVTEQQTIFERERAKAELVAKELLEWQRILAHCVSSSAQQTAGSITSCPRQAQIEACPHERSQVAADDSQGFAERWGRRQEFIDRVRKENCLANWRVQLLEDPALANRIGAFVNLLRHRAYGGVRAGRLPLKFFAYDLLVSLKGV